MEKSWFTLFSFVSLVCFFFNSGSVEAAKAVAKGSKTSCSACHSDLSTVVPEGHPTVKGRDISACLGCHKPNVSDEATKNTISAVLHRVHVGEDSKVDCIMCHTWAPGKRFGLLGAKVSFGAPTKEELDEIKKIFVSWKSSGYTDSLHGKANVVCGGCHGSHLPKEGDTVENDRCLLCHGPLDRLQAKTSPEDSPRRNPHQSHVGDIGCTVCHHAHSASKVYCLECHTFKMKIQGAGLS